MLHKSKMNVIGKAIIYLTFFLFTLSRPQDAQAENARFRLGYFSSLSAIANAQKSYADVDWAEPPTPEQAMRDAGRYGFQSRSGLVLYERIKIALSFGYQERLPKGVLGYGLYNLGLHLAFQEDPSNKISWGVGLDIDKLISTQEIIDAGFRLFPHFVWDFFA